MPDGYRTGPLTEEARTSSDPTLVDEGKVSGKGNGGQEELEYTPSDDPFGDESNAEVKYKVLTWW